jgi:hypothetical protein
MTPVAHFYFNGQYDLSLMNSSSNPFIGTLDILIRSSNNEIPLGSSAQGNFVGYSLVKVMDVDLLGNSLGKSVYHYTNEPEELTPYHLPGIYGRANHGNGELIKEEYFNTDGNIDNTRILNFEQNESETIITKGTVTPFGMDKPPWESQAVYTYFMRFYDVVSDWRYLSETIETTYDLNGANPITATTNYEYANPGHKQLTTITTQASDGRNFVTTLEYPSDNPSGTSISTATFDRMVTDNMLSPLIKQESILD